MAQKPSPNSLIHCVKCGEDYSATYKVCPFCGTKNTPSQPDSDRSSSDDLEDTYVFDGQDLFDEEESEDSAANTRGGKRLADRPIANPFANAEINWPRVITFICSLVIIVAAMVIVFTVVYPQLRDPNGPTANSTGSPSANVTDPAGGSSQGVEPSPDVSGAATDPGTDPSAVVSPNGSTGLKGFTTNISGPDKDGFTLRAGESWQIKLTFDPVDWSGEVSYSISDETYATVSANGNVTNVNRDSKLHGVVLTITAGGVTLDMPVYCAGGGSAASDPPATNPPATTPPATNPPATNPPATDPPATQSPSGSGGDVAGKKGTVINAPDGLRVRSGPGTDYERIGRLVNGNTVTILEKTDNGWYKISFTGANGATEGYVLSTCISVS